MKITVDANILFACLIREGQTRKMWFNPELQLFAPSFIIVEFLKYKKLIQKKFGSKEKEFDRLVELVLNQINFVSDDELKPFLPAAVFLLEDSKDWLYLACALKEDTIVWSNDKGFKKQKRVGVKTTSEMIEADYSL